MNYICSNKELLRNIIEGYMPFGVSCSSLFFLSNTPCVRIPIMANYSCFKLYCGLIL